ncbi:hypothetical protein KI387_001972, partial [Taxus chinensis]
DIKSPTFNKRIRILGLMAQVHSYVIMFDYDGLILQLFDCFISGIKKCHSDKVKVDMFNMLFEILDEDYDVCKRLRFDLLDIWRGEKHASTATYDLIRRLVEQKIEKFKEQLTAGELTSFGLQVPSSLQEDSMPSPNGSIEWDDEYIEQPEPSCVKTLNKGIDDDFTDGISVVLIPVQNESIQDFAEKEFQAQLEANHCPHSLKNQLKVNEDGVVAALSHHDKMHKLIENHFWMVQLERRQKGIEAESSHDSLQEIKDGMGTMKTNYLHLHSNRDHLLNLAEVYSDALRRKEEEVDKLSQELEVTRDSLVSTQLALQDSESHVDELCLELSLARDSLCISETQSSMAAKAHVEDSSMSSSSIHIQDTGAVPCALERHEESVRERYMIELSISFSLWVGDRHVGNSIPMSSSWVLPPTSLIDGCPPLLVGVLSGDTLREAAVGMERSDWDGHFGIRGWSNDDFFSSLGSRDTFCSIMDMIHRLQGVVLIYASNLSDVGICFYAPSLGIFHICRGPFSVDWFVDDIDTSVMAAGPGVIGDMSTRLYFGTLETDLKQFYQKELGFSRTCTLDFGIDPVSFQIVDGIHDDILLTPESETGHLQLLCGRGLDEVAARSTHPIVSCESSSGDGSMGWNTPDYSGIPLTQSGEFHLGCIMRCVHQFSFIPHVQDLMMTLMTQRGGLNKGCSDSLWYDMLQISDDESKLFSPDSCSQKQELEVWLDWTLGGIRVAQWKSVGVEGLPVYPIMIFKVDQHSTWSWHYGVDLQDWDPGIPLLV